MKNIKQGDIYLVNFDPSVDSEIKKKRPAIVINDDNMGRFGISIIVPITKWKEYFVDYPWIIKLTNTPNNGLKKESGIECFQIKSFSQKRFIKKIGYADDKTIRNIHTIIAKIFNPKYKIQMI